MICPYCQVEMYIEPWEGWVWKCKMAGTPLRPWLAGQNNEDYLLIEE